MLSHHCKIVCTQAQILGAKKNKEKEQQEKGPPTPPTPPPKPRPPPNLHPPPNPPPPAKPSLPPKPTPVKEAKVEEDFLVRLAREQQQRDQVMRYTPLATAIIIVT